MTKEQTINNFQLLIQEAERLSNVSFENGDVVWDGFERWRVACYQAIELMFGTGDRFQDFQKILYVPPVPLSRNPNTTTKLAFFLLGLKRAKELLEGMVISIAMWLPNDQVVSHQPIVFLSYGGKGIRSTINKIGDFLKAFGASPIIVEDLPNIGKNLSDKVQLYMQACNCAIVVLTATDITAEGKLTVRGNISHEIGCLQTLEQTKNRVIYLKERGVNLPSNYSSIAWHEFNRSQLDTTYVKILQELRAFGF